jgi:hypothetical protein
MFSTLVQLPQRRLCKLVDTNGLRVGEILPHHFAIHTRRLRSFFGFNLRPAGDHVHRGSRHHFNGGVAHTERTHHATAARQTIVVDATGTESSRPLMYSPANVTAAVRMCVAFGRCPLVNRA